MTCCTCDTMSMLHNLHKKTNDRKRKEHVPKTVLKKKKKKKKRKKMQKNANNEFIRSQVCHRLILRVSHVLRSHHNVITFQTPTNDIPDPHNFQLEIGVHPTKCKLPRILRIESVHHVLQCTCPSTKDPKIPPRSTLSLLSTTSQDGSTPFTPF